MTDMIGIKNISVFLPGQEDIFFTGVVRMKLYTVSTGDTAYRYEKSIVVFFKVRVKYLALRFLMAVIMKIIKLYLTTMVRLVQGCHVRC